MSDYLSHLVLRQISPEVGVRPRIASLFAPSEHVPEEGVGFTVSTEEREGAGPAQRRAAPAARWTAVARALAPRPEESRGTVPSGALGRAQGPMSVPGPERAAVDEPSAVAPMIERGLTIETSSEAPSKQRSTLSAPAHTGVPSPLPATREEGDAIEEPEALKPPSVARAAVTPRNIRKALRIEETPLNHRGTPAERQEPVELPAPARTPVGDKSPASAPGSATMPDAATHEEVRAMSRREVAPMREEAGTADRASSEGIAFSRSSEASRGTEAPGPIRVGPAFQLQAGREAAAPLPAAPESAAAPVVQVTIGRIEVRAVTPPAPAKPAPARSVPAMSLDEYLQRRNGGRR